MQEKYKGLDCCTRNSPDPARIIGDPDLGESNQVATLASRIFNEFAGLFDGRLKVEVAALGLYRRYPDGSLSGGHGGFTM